MYITLLLQKLQYLTVFVLQQFLFWQKTEAFMLYALGRRCFTALMMGVVMTPHNEGREEAGPLLAKYLQHILATILGTVKLVSKAS